MELRHNIFTTIMERTEVISILEGARRCNIFCIEWGDLRL